MENATKALLMAGGVLIAIIIISVIVITLQKTGNVNKTYDSTIKQQEIMKFNSNFTKYVGEDKKFTIHDAITITNFAQNHGVTVNDPKTISDIDNDTAKEKKYILTINSYADNGYINSITISQ